MNNKKIFFSSKGITLISLIITLIILIILAAVAIIGLTQTDIISMASKSSESYAEEQIKEKDEFDNLNEKVTNATNTISGKDTYSGLTEEQITQIFQKKSKAGTVTVPYTTANTSITIEVTFDEPFEDTNYSVSITPLDTPSGWPWRMYATQSKTPNGFHIVYHNINSPVAAHQVDWIAMSYNN